MKATWSFYLMELLNTNSGVTEHSSSVADSKMKNTHKDNFKFLRPVEGDFEEMVARKSSSYQDEGCTETTGGRNPHCPSGGTEWDDGPVMTNEDYGRITGSSHHSEFLQIRNKRQHLMKCPPIVSDKNASYHRGNNPLLVMKIVKRKRCRRNMGDGDARSRGQRNSGQLWERANAEFSHKAGKCAARVPNHHRRSREDAKATSAAAAAKQSTVWTTEEETDEGFPFAFLQQSFTQGERSKGWNRSKRDRGSSKEEKKELFDQHAPKSTVVHEEESRALDPVPPLNSSTSTVSLLLLLKALSTSVCIYSLLSPPGLNSGSWTEFHKTFPSLLMSTKALCSNVMFNSVGINVEAHPSLRLQFQQSRETFIHWVFYIWKVWEAQNLALHMY